MLPSSRAIHNLARQGSSSRHGLVRPMTTAVTPRNRDQLHAAASKQHIVKTLELEREVLATKDLPFIDIPHDLRVHFRDTVAVREYKLKQQQQYYLLEKYGFVLDGLVKMGCMPAEEVEALQARRAQRIKDPPSTHKVNTTVKLSQVQALSQKIAAQLNDPSLAILDTDSKDVKFKKTQTIVKMLAVQATTQINTTIANFIPNDRNAITKETDEIKRILMEKDGYAYYKVDPDKFLAEHQDELARAADIGDVSEFLNKMQQQMKERCATHTVANLIGDASMLKELGLVLPHSMQDLEREINSVQALHKQRSEEFDLRYGNLPIPSADEDPYAIEFEKQRVFLEQQLEARRQAKLEAPAAAEAAPADPAASATPATPAATGGEKKKYGERDSDYVQDRSMFRNRDEMEADMRAYMAQNSGQKFIDDDMSNPAWPRMVDGLDLAKYEHMRNFNWAEFELPPNSLEVRVLDAFEKQRQFREAKEKSITMIPRVELPIGPEDPSVVKKVLHLYRISAIRNYLKELKRRQKAIATRDYRDLDALRLDVPYDPAHPWIYNVWHETIRVLNNQAVWTQQQKETYLKNLHRFLTKTDFSEENLEKEGVSFKVMDFAKIK